MEQKLEFDPRFRVSDTSYLLHSLNFCSPFKILRMYVYDQTCHASIYIPNIGIKEYMKTLAMLHENL